LEHNKYTIQDMYILSKTLHNESGNIMASLKGDITMRVEGGCTPEQILYMIKKEYPQYTSFIISELPYEDLPLYISINTEPESSIIKWRLLIRK
jgi:hypothetical protein